MDCKKIINERIRSMKFNLGFMLLLLAACSGTTMHQKLVGKWKVEKCEWSGPAQKYKGLNEDYYKLYEGEVREFNVNACKWAKAKKYISYTLNEANSTIEFKKDTINILALNNQELVTREIKGKDTLLTHYKRISN
jgi:hypothetical protein